MKITFFICSLAALAVTQLHAAPASVIAYNIWDGGWAKPGSYPRPRYGYSRRLLEGKPTTQPTLSFFPPLIHSSQLAPSPVGQQQPPQRRRSYYLHEGACHPLAIRALKNFRPLLAPAPARHRLCANMLAPHPPLRALPPPVPHSTRRASLR